MTREDAIKIFNTVLLFGRCDCPKEDIEECFKMAIKALEQEPKTGHWIPHTDRGMIECSECHAEERTAHLLHSNFCPNCGTKMAESEDKE